MMSPPELVYVTIHGKGVIHVLEFVLVKGAGFAVLLRPVRVVLTPSVYCAEIVSGADSNTQDLERLLSNGRTKVPSELGYIMKTRRHCKGGKVSELKW